jgi:2-dehydropantoate 2-reductase
MRVLVVGAGAIGGYFGGQLLHAGRDVTFLVRPHRAAELASAGLVIKSSRGDLRLQSPPTILSENIREPFDLVLLSCKAYDLAAAVDSFAAAVGPATLILPVLNGMRHLDALDERFGASHVLGGLCIIAATLDAQRSVVHLNDQNSLVFGPRDETARDETGRDGARSERVRAVEQTLQNAGFDARLSGQIVHEMWEKWVLLASLAAVTCLMRASIGDTIAAPGGSPLILAILDECAAIAAGAGFAPRAAFMDRARAALTAKESTLTASMLRDLESNAPVEADHVLGDLLRRAVTPTSRTAPSPLSIAYTHLKAYETRRARVQAVAQHGG